MHVFLQTLQPAEVVCLPGLYRMNGPVDIVYGRWKEDLLIPKKAHASLIVQKSQILPK